MSTSRPVVFFISRWLRPRQTACLGSALSAAPADRIIVALDGMAPEKALRFAAQVEGLRWVKVVAQLRDQGCWPTGGGPRVGSRGTSCAGSQLVTNQAAPGSCWLAVTVLTSWEEQRLQRELAIAQGIAERVPALAQLSATAGIGGCVCSPLEAAALRAQHPEPFALVTPGIRPKGAAVGDQARVMGPAEAIAAGASQLVIGRPITKAEDPSAAFAACCGELMPR